MLSVTPLVPVSDFMKSWELEDPRSSTRLQIAVASTSAGALSNAAVRTHLCLLACILGGHSPQGLVWAKILPSSMSAPEERWSQFTLQLPGDLEAVAVTIFGQDNAALTGDAPQWVNRWVPEHELLAALPVLMLQLFAD